MGGKYADIIQGEIEGLKTGINTDIKLWKYCQGLKSEDYSRDYFVGIGVGFTKAQYIRDRLREENLSMSFERKLDLFRYLLANHWNRLDKWAKLSAKFIKNINHWGDEKIPNRVVEGVNQLLRSGKTQRALDGMLSVLYEESRLELLVGFDKIRVLLPQLRGRKRRKEIDSEEYLREKIKITEKLVQWMERHRARSAERPK